MYKIVASVSYILIICAPPCKPFLSTWEQVQRPGAESREQVLCYFCAIEPTQKSQCSLLSVFFAELVEMWKIIRFIS